MRYVKASCLPLFACALLGVAPAARAARSGLNNVPTADVSPPNVAVIHVYSAFGPQRDTSFLTGARTGFTLGGQKFEAGVDSRWDPRPNVPAFFNAKWGRQSADKRSALGIGVANLAPDREGRHRLGQPQSYFAVTHDFEAVRVTAGYALQAHNDAWFAGLDRSFTVFGHKLVLRGDAIQVQDRSQWLLSAGATYRFSTLFGLELWENHPTERGRNYTTAKFALYVNF